MQQVQRGERLALAGGTLALRLLHGRHDARNLALLLLLARVRAFVEAVVDVLLGWRLSFGLLVSVVARGGLVLDVAAAVVSRLLSQEELEHGEHDARGAVERGRRQHVDSACVAPHVPPPQLSAHRERLLGGRLVVVLNDPVHEGLQRAVELLVAGVPVGVLDVRHDVAEQERAQLLVLAAEETEKERQHRHGLNLVAVAHQHERLNQRAPQRRLERRIVRVEQLHHLARKARSLGGVAADDLRHKHCELAELFGILAGLELEDVDERLEMAALQQELIMVSLRVALDAGLQRQQI
mmetsp:Transcript_14045/g.40777  ORF Transcript_14045/g.40777 Transcript_14045/m.40777 type:complete len:296 (-) Transcript_14045:243-1130(-)